MMVPITAATPLAAGTHVHIAIGDDHGDYILARRTDDERGWWLNDGSWIADNHLECYGTIDQFGVCAHADGRRRMRHLRRTVTTCTPGDAEWQQRLHTYLSDPTPPSWWWLSFIDPQRPEGDRFLGVCIVPAPNSVAAGIIAHSLGCNPGGEAAAYQALPDGWRPRDEYIGRLFTRAEAETLTGINNMTTWARPDN